MNFNIQRFATGFIDPKVATLKVEVDLNENGNIAMSGKTPAGTKTITFNGFTAAGSGTVAFTNAQTVFTKVLGGIAGATFNSASAQRIITEKTGVVE